MSIEKSCFNCLHEAEFEFESPCSDCKHYSNWYYVNGTPEAVDMVNQPPHYTNRRYEVIDVMKDTMTKDGFEGYLEGAIIKYIMRFKEKTNPLEDLKKAQWYLNKLITEIENDEMEEF